MQIKKESNLIEKIVKRSYKNELEEILEDKYFDETAKSLLLEILYKMETAYKDYEVVKIDAQTKEEYIKDFMRIIQKKCKNIKIVAPNSEQSKLLDGRTFIVKPEKDEIICLPIARKLLYSISKIDKKEKTVKKEYYLLSTTLSNLINIGNNINTVEPLRDFNGWSWTTVPREIESIEYNLIYQIMLILLGEKFLSEWVQNKNSILDYVEELQNKIEGKYGKETAKEFLETLNKLSVLLELKVNRNIKKEIQNSIIEVEKKLSKFENKQNFIQELTLQKNKLKEKIKQIDTTINNKEILQEEYIKRNENLPLEEKIFSMRVLTQIMAKEREELLNKMEELNSLLKPKNFVAKKEELKKELSILKLGNVEDEQKELEEALQTFQHIFLKCFKKKIKKAETKQEIANLIYQFRYYCLLPYNEANNVFSYEETQKMLEEAGKLLIKKAIEKKVIIEFSENEKTNYEIIKNVFAVRIVQLEDLYMKIVKEKDQYFIQFFDENAFEQKISIGCKLEKKELKVRPNKKVKLFE